MKINAVWHEAHKMPKNPMKEEKIAWHFEHAKYCNCHEMPEWIKTEIKNYKKNEEPVILLPYDSNWTKKFEREKELLEKKIGKYITGGIHHVGSTAIPGLPAKPIVDILIGVESLPASRICIEILKKIDYVYFPYKEQYEHWFCKPNPEHREFHLHIMPTGSPEFKAKIAFRDYLIAHPDAIKRYEELKTGLAQKFHNDREAYTDAKTKFVREIVAKAFGKDFQFET